MGCDKAAYLRASDQQMTAQENFLVRRWLTGLSGIAALELAAQIQ